MDVKELSITLKWCGKEFQITDLTDHDTVEMLKHEICKKTQVKPVTRSSGYFFFPSWIKFNILI